MMNDAILRYLREHGTEALTFATIATALGVSERTVIRYLQRLESEKRLRVKRVPGGASVYTVRK